MTTFEVHSVETAPPKAQPVLTALQKQLGMIPNLAAAMAESPQLLEGFTAIRKLFYSGSFSPAEIQVLALTNAYENGCRYCMALHSTFALQEGVSKESVDALRQGCSPLEVKLSVLSDFSRKLIQKRGNVSEADLEFFQAAGFTKAQALEVVLGIAVSILPNYAHHLTQCPVDEPFSAQLWSPPLH
jgi:uncharacterized peroxidase-related enzyme